MDRYFQADAVNSLPDLTKLVSEGYPTNGDPALGIPATMPGEAWFYAITEELRNVIVAAGLTPDKLNVAQLSSAINSLITGSVPTGEVKIFAGSTIPDGFLLCNGAAVSRTDYELLFTAIGTTYGAGDGSTTFNLPDMRNRYPIGAGDNALGSYLAEQLPNVKGYIYGRTTVDGLTGIIWGDKRLFTGGANTETTVTTGYAHTGQNLRYDLAFDASAYNSIYKDSGHVYPRSLALNYIIKA